MPSFLECWIEAASVLFRQALAGAPELSESFPRPFDSGAFSFAAIVEGDLQGRFSVTIDNAVLERPLLGEGRDQKNGWGELLREVCEAAAGELLARTGCACRVINFEPCSGDTQASRAFLLGSTECAWAILVRDETRPAEKAASRPAQATPPPVSETANPTLRPSVELLMDVELEVTLRFGCREMSLGEMLELGPGDVVQLDRNVSDPVDLIVGDKIVARGDVVLVNGNFGLCVTEVAAPCKRLESIRCLF